VARSISYVQKVCADLFFDLTLLCAGFSIPERLNLMKSLDQPFSPLASESGDMAVETDIERTREYETALVRQILANEGDAFDEFYRRYVPRLYRAIYYACSSRQDDAEDILQETMLAAIRSLKRFHGKSSLYTWLYAIARHKIQDYYRRGNRQKAHLSPTPPDDFAIPLADSSPSPDSLVIHRDMLQRALANLPVHYRIVLIGKYVDGFSVKELAVILHRSEKSVESMLTRSRAALRNALSDDTEPQQSFP